MIGGMIETRVAMGCSFSLVLGLGGISILDLDTPLLLAEDPFDSGGYQYTGPILSPWYEPGLGLRLQKRTGLPYGRPLEFGLLLVSCLINKLA